jgi:hypothetical protein
MSATSSCYGARANWYKAGVCLILGSAGLILSILWMTLWAQVSFLSIILMVASVMLLVFGACSVRQKNPV